MVELAYLCELMQELQRSKRQLIHLVKEKLAQMMTIVKSRVKKSLAELRENSDNLAFRF